MGKVEVEEERMRRENSLDQPKTVSPRTRELIDQHSLYRTDAQRRGPIDLASEKAIVETNLCPEITERPGLTITPPVDEVCKTIDVLTRLAVEMGTVRGSVEGYTDFDGFACAAIYVDRVIKEQYADQFPSLEHKHTLNQLYLDPLQKYMAVRDYVLDPVLCHITGKVLRLIREYIEYHLEHGWPRDNMEKLAKLIMVDRQLNNIIAPWLRHRINKHRRVVRVTTPGWREDGWLYQKLKEVQNGDVTRRDFFNMWTLDGGAIPRDDIEKCVDPTLPPLTKDTSQ